MAVIRKEIRICDVCNRDADGQFERVTEINGNIYTREVCQLDLCDQHMAIFGFHLDEYAIDIHDSLNDIDDMKEVSNEWLIEEIKRLQ